MRIVSLSGTDLSTSRLGFGTSGLHQLLLSRQRQTLLAAAFQAGVRHFDSSPFYGHGIAERELGKFSHVRRSEVLIATKFGIKPNAILAHNPWLLYGQLAANAALRKVAKQNLLILTPKRDYSAREAQLSLERSLRALRTDHVDIYFLHEPSRASLEQNEELRTMLDRLRREGKARYIGLAGSARDCVAVAHRFPGMAQVLQIDASAGREELAIVNGAALTCQLSFGHFRGKRAPLRSLLGDAVKMNRNGVLLYSTRYPARVQELAASLNELEKP